MPDIMHDLLEGALQYEVKLMLREMIKVEKIFSLGTRELNGISFICNAVLFMQLLSTVT